MPCLEFRRVLDRKSTRLNSSHTLISYAVFCLKKHTGQPAKREDARPWRRRDSRGEQLSAAGPPACATRRKAWPPADGSTCPPFRFFLKATATPESYPLPLRAPLPS